MHVVNPFLPNANPTPIRGTVRTAVDDDVARLGELRGLEPSLVAVARTLADEIDAGGGEGRFLAALSKELRAALEQLAAARRGREPSDRPNSAAEPPEDPEDADLDVPE